MAYTFSDANKKSWPGPSINGLRQVKKLMDEYKAPRPALQQLLTHGHTNMLAALSIECHNLSKKTSDQNIKSTLRSMVAVARQANEVVILES